MCATILAASCIVAIAQPPVKKDTGKKAVPSKPAYNYFIAMPAQDYQQIMGALTEYKTLQIYNPNSDDKSKVTLFKSIESYLKDLPGRIKVDSVLVKK